MYTVTFSKQSTFVVTGSEDKTIVIWNVQTGEEIKTLVGHLDIVETLIISKNDKYIVSGSWDKTIKIWNI